MLTLGHITYSNCFPPHAGIVTGKTAFPFELREGIPSDLNSLLLAGKVDVSPSSSIEYAKNPGRYLLLPNLSITSRKEVRSIILKSRVPMQDLNGKSIALTTASATSVILLKVLLERHYSLTPRYSGFRQGADDPSGVADAMLFIGDLALKTRATAEYPYLYDLGDVWYGLTGLPFVFALWQLNYKKNIDKELAVLYDSIMASKAYGLANIARLAKEQAERFDLPSELLTEYWNSFSYDFGESEKKGLMTFYQYAADIGAVDPVRELQFWEKS